MLVIISNNCPPLWKSEIEYYAMLLKVGVHHYRGTNNDLGTACGKFHKVCCMSIIDPGEFLFSNQWFVFRMLSKLTQTTMVMEYQTAFEALLNKPFSFFDRSMPSPQPHLLLLLRRAAARWWGDEPEPPATTSRDPAAQGLGNGQTRPGSLVAASVPANQQLRRLPFVLQPFRAAVVV
ncbi:unnamed protein product [Cuscuta campestris]|uniref:Ribosomal protein eL8/eL30/eS12/Gadd45 domain-containing protein n=1 Tax=Cuscuta campestris TaxID=132261 RepID=A0A484KVU6_9ASTE|nr:unnamed protein product [Cuscuta campestris]